MVTIVKAASYEQLSRQAAQIIAAQIFTKPESVLGLATGGTPVGAYQELIRLYRQDGLDFSRVTSFNLDEYWGSGIDDPNSYAAYMQENLFGLVNIRREAAYLPNGLADDAQQECEQYEARIVQAGGIDLQLLGIGHNGHIGFNEPADYFPSATHLVELAQSTIDANSRYYQSKEEVPRSAVSMGIGTIMKARSILLLAGGPDKHDIMEQALYGPVTPKVPASILQFHPRVTVIMVE